ncbi:unnamed protein product [Penicillium salamii]|uniref:Calcineurin-like phosphoesterase domain-containing protein n=1 Tax=Penicillium salamii TaxID=1612424 RepID=A0A9W4K0G5_9EURO|nr:unnamed protein product [Penicillium salamii]
MAAADFQSGFQSDADEDFPPASTLHSSYSRQYQPSRPLIESARNGWQSQSRISNRHSSSPSGEAELPKWTQMIQSIVSAPRLRRYALIYLSFFIVAWLGWRTFLSPRFQERNSILSSLDPDSRPGTVGRFGANSMPHFNDLVHIQQLSPDLVPVDLASVDADSKKRKRLVIVGDVHGCKEELEKLLEKVKFNQKGGDHLIFVGDMINKGPDSIGVVDLARQYSASSVRGNHEDRILLRRREMIRTKTLGNLDDATASDYSSRELSERALARSLSDEQVQWLEKCPVILDVGQVPNMGQVVVVHAGLVPEIALEKQDPVSVMTMRTIDLDTHVPNSKKKGTNWAKMFDKHQSVLYSSLESTSENPRAKTMTVVYGHDAHSSLSIRTFTKGLDSGCVKGGKLTALVIEDGGKQSIVQVSCRGYVKD